MRSTLESFAAPAPYRRASILLLLASFGLPIAIALLGGPDWLGFLTGAPAYLLLIVLTYRRLRDGALSGGWIALMVFAFNFGPSLDGPGPITFYLGNMLNLVPVILA